MKDRTAIVTAANMERSGVILMRWTRHHNVRLDPHVANSFQKLFVVHQSYPYLFRKVQNCFYKSERSQSMLFPVQFFRPGENLIDETLNPII
jgi:hypothetical protein